MPKAPFPANGRGLPKSKLAENRTRPIVIHPGLPERFWQKVDKSGGPDACWLWQGKPQNGGYGVIHRGGGHTDTIYAHRLSYFLATGCDPIGWCVCHRCDVPGCVNPAHLFLGTMADNTRDMIAKGRMVIARTVRGAAPKGEDVGSAKLTAAQVVEIRSRAARGEGSGSLGKAFGSEGGVMSDTATERTAPRRRRKLVPRGVPFSELSPGQQKAVRSLQKLREQMAAEIERMIDFLDSTDGYSSTEIEEDEADPSEALIRRRAPAPAGTLEDDEPSLGFVENHPTPRFAVGGWWAYYSDQGRQDLDQGTSDDREGDEHDGREPDEGDFEDGGDDEPSLGWTEVETRKGRYCNNGLDLEQDDAFRDTDLGWTHAGALGDHRDLEINEVVA